METFYGRFRSEDCAGFVYEGVVIVKAKDKFEAYKLIMKRMNDTLYGEDSLITLESLGEDVVLIHNDEDCF